MKIAHKITPRQAARVQSPEGKMFGGMCTQTRLCIQTHIRTLKRA